MRNSGARFPIWLAICAGFFIHSAALLAQGAPDFLVIVDLSRGMEPRRQATVRTIQDLVRTGFHQRIQPGQQFGVWFWTGSLGTNAVYTWDFDALDSLNQRVARLLANRPYALIRSEVDWNAIVKSTAKPLTAFFLTDGSQAIRGTPFDSVLNAAIASHRAQFAEVLKPFLITLLARDGVWVAGGIHTNLGAAVRLPEFPPESSLLDKAVEALRVAAAAADPPATNAPTQSPVSVPEAPIVAAQAPQEPSRPASAPPRTEPISTPPPLAATPAPSPVEAAPAAVEAPPPATAEIAIPVLAPVAPAPPAEPLATTPDAQEEKSPSSAPQQPDPIAATAEVAPALAMAPPPKTFPWLWLLAAFSAIGFGGWATHRRLSNPQARGGSLISKSLDPLDGPPSLKNDSSSRS